MTKKFFLTTAIDYPNSRPHIGTAFEKLGADVQARYRRMEGDDVFFLMGNDENTLKVAKRVLNLAYDTPLHVGLELEGLAYGLLRSTSDFAEGVAAFAERRPPKYTGS